MNSLAAVAEEVAEESNRCNLFARLLYELFSHEHFPEAEDAASPNAEEPPQKKAKSSSEAIVLSSARGRGRGDFDYYSRSNQQMSRYRQAGDCK